MQRGEFSVAVPADGQGTRRNDRHRALLFIHPGITFRLLQNFTQNAGRKAASR